MVFYRAYLSPFCVFEVDDLDQTAFIALLSGVSNDQPLLRDGANDRLIGGLGTDAITDDDGDDD